MYLTFFFYNINELVLFYGSTHCHAFLLLYHLVVVVLLLLFILGGFKSGLPGHLFQVILSRPFYLRGLSIDFSESLLTFIKFFAFSNLSYRIDKFFCVLR